MGDRRGAPILALLVALQVAPLGAQDTVAVRGASPDSVSLRRRAVPVPRPDVPTAPLPRGGRVTLTRDSLLWTSAVTLGDILVQAVPGAYVARAGFWGQPEYLQYGGRGGTALEVYWDGVPYQPLGLDSVFVDPGQIPLTYLNRIDIEILPGTIRVHLVSERHEGSAPRSNVRVVSGAFETGAYAGLFQKRWPSGLGVDLAADFVGTQGSPTASRSTQSFDMWAKLTWALSPTTGMSYQIRRQERDRPPIAVAGQSGVPELAGMRSDAVLSVFAGAGPGTTGLGVQSALAVSRWASDSAFPVPDQEVRQAIGTVRYGRRNLDVRLEGRVADRRTPLTVQGHAGWVPVRGLVLTGEVGWQRHDYDRQTLTAGGSAGIDVGLVALTGDLRMRDGPRAPVIAADTAVRTVDRAVRFRLDTGPLDGTVALVSRGAFHPLPFPELATLPRFPAVPRTTWLEAEARLWPSAALSVGAWYADPLDDGVAVPLTPPHHARADVTLRSKYWRTFRSGAFDVMLELAMESWSTGVAGLDQQGNTVTLPGATFFQMFVQFQIAEFTAFWDFRNARLTTADYVPGLDYPRQAQTFGVSWSFRN